MATDDGLSDEIYADVANALSGVGSGTAAGPHAGSAAAASPGGSWEATRRQEEAQHAASFLLREKYLLTALELHQELMERAGGMHDVAELNTFFADPSKVDAVVSAETESNPAINAALPALSAVPSPYDPYSSHSTLEERDQQIALLAYKLRIADDDKETLQQQLERAAAEAPLAAAGGGGGSGGGLSATTSGTGSAGDGAAGSASHGGGGADVTEITDHERRTLNVLVKQYLMATGSKLTAVTLSEEASDQDLDDLASVGLRGHSTSLVAMFRDRIVPLEDVADMKQALAKAQAECDALRSTLVERERQVSKLKDAVDTAENKVAAALRAKAAAVQSLATLTEAAEAMDEYPAGRGDVSDDTPRDLAGELVSAVGANLPAVAQCVVTKQRITILPLFAAAVAAHPAAETRRSLMSAMLTLVKRPSAADRAVIVEALRSMADLVGPVRCEQEVMPQVLAMATHKTRERRAVAAEACGMLAQFVSDKRCDSLLATLTMLADDDHAVVRCAVASGMAKLADTLSHSNSSDSRRQYAEVEDLLWRSLLEGADAETAAGVEHGAVSMSDDADLWVETPGDDGARTVVAVVLHDALPVVARWARSLGWLWSRLVPLVLSILRDTLSSKAPSTGESVHSGSRSVGSRFSSDFESSAAPGPSHPVTLWHQNRCAALLTALQRMTPSLALYLLDDGLVVYTRGARSGAGAKPVADAAVDGSATPPVPAVDSDHVYRVGGEAEPCDPATAEVTTLEGIERWQGATGLAGRGELDASRLADSSAALSAILSGRAFLEWMPVDSVAGAAGDDNAGSDSEASAAPSGTWSRVPWSEVALLAVEWEGLRCLLHDVVPQLMEDAAGLDRGSAVGRTITDQYASMLRRLCAVLGTHFVAHAVRPLFKRALGLSLRGVSGATSPHDAAHSRDFSLLRKVLFGVSGSAPETPASGGDSEYSDEVEWFMMLPTLEWLGLATGDAPSTPSSTVGPGSSGGAGAGAGVSGAASVGGGSEAWGSAWRAETLLPLFSSGVLSCTALPSAHLRGALRELIVRVAQKAEGWGLTQSLLETVFVRVGRHPSVLPTVLSLLQRVATNSKESVRAVVATLFQSLVPVLSSGQITSPVLPALLSLSTDSSPVVVKAAVRALTSLYLEVSDPMSLKRVNAEVASLLERGPKEVIVEVMRAFMRGIPRANAELRDGFMLTQVLTLAERVAVAAQAGVQELKDICAAIGNVGDDERAAAEQAAAAAREAAVQANAPWAGAKLEDLEEVAMVTLECMRAFGSCLLSASTRDRLLPGLRGLLLDADLVDPSYRDMMVMTLTGMGLQVQPEVEDDAGEHGAGDDLLGATPAPSKTMLRTAAGGGATPSSASPAAPVARALDPSMASVATPPRAPPPSSAAASSAGGGDGGGLNTGAVTVMSLSSFSGPAAPSPSPSPSRSSAGDALSPDHVEAAVGGDGEADGGAKKGKFGRKMFGKIKGIRARAKARMTRKGKDDAGGGDDDDDDDAV